MQPDNPADTPAAIVEALEKKVDQQYPDRRDPDQQRPEPAEDTAPGGDATEANTTEPPD